MTWNHVSSPPSKEDVQRMLGQLRAVHEEQTGRLVDQVLKARELEDEARRRPSDTADALGRLLDKFKAPS